MKASSGYARVLGQRLRMARTRRDLRCIDVEQRTGIGWGIISAFETGKRYPTVDEVLLICRKTGIPHEELFPEDGEE